MRKVRRKEITPRLCSLGSTVWEQEKHLSNKKHINHRHTLQQGKWSSSSRQPSGPAPFSALATDPPVRLAVQSDGGEGSGEGRYVCVYFALKSAKKKAHWCAFFLRRTSAKSWSRALLCPTGMGVAGVDVVLVSIGEALRCWWLHLSFWSRMLKRAAGRQYWCSQCWVTLGLCTVPCKRYHTLKNYKRWPDWANSWSNYQKTGTCILLWHSNKVIIYYILLFYCYFLFSW